MTHDNPFQKLAKEFFVNNSGKKNDSGPGALSREPDSGRKAKKNDQPAGPPDGDSALFLEAVRNVSAMPGRRGAGRPLDELLRGGLAEKERRNAAPGRWALAEDQNAARPFAEKSASSAGESGKGASSAGESGKGALSAGKSGKGALSAGKSGKTAPGADKPENGAPGAARREPAAFFENEPPGSAAPGARTEDPGSDGALFAKAMSGVSRINCKGRDVAVPAANGKAQASVDPARLLQDILDGKLEFALHHTDEFMEGFVVGLDPMVMARLRAGQYSPESHLDLHGLNARQAYDALGFYIKNAYQRGMRTLVVVTGRGRNSPDGVGVLRPLLQRWLCRDPFKRVVLAFCTAKPSDGGPGAVYVLLRKFKKSRGKIIWDYTPTDDDFPDF